MTKKASGLFFLIIVVLVLILLLVVIDNFSKIPKPKSVCVAKIVNNTEVEECKNVSSYLDRIPKVKWE